MAGVRRRGRLDVGRRVAEAPVVLAEAREDEPPRLVREAARVRAAPLDEAGLLAEAAAVSPARGGANALAWSSSCVDELACPLWDQSSACRSALERAGSDRLLGAIVGQRLVRIV